METLKVHTLRRIQDVSGLSCSVTYDWTGTGFSCPVRPGFIGSLSRCLSRKYWEKTIGPDRQSVRQEVIQQRSWWAASDDLCLVQECWMSRGYSTVLNGRLQILWRVGGLSDDSQNVKMSKCHVIAPYQSCVELPAHQAADEEGNESLHGPFLTFLSELWQPPPRNRVGQPVDGWFPSKSEKLWYASLACWTAQTDFSQFLLNLIWLIWVHVPVLGDFVPVYIWHTLGLQITQTSGSHFLSLNISPFSVCKCSLWSLFKVHRNPN